jgi:peptidoglycan hydrolase FlgJ
MSIFSSISPQNSIQPQIEQSRATQLSDLANLGRSKTNKKLKSVSRQFESIFVHQLLKSMRSTVQKAGMFGSHATEMYESLHDEEMAKLMTEQKGIGLAEIIYRDLARVENQRKKVQTGSEISTQKPNPLINIQG